MKVSGEIYLVYGEHGEYSEHREWDVAAFTSEDKAKIFRDLVQRKYQESRTRFQEDSERYWETGDKPYPEESDYAFQEDPNTPIASSYEVTYSVTAVKLNPKF